MSKSIAICKKIRKSNANTGGAAGLVALLGVMLILYVLFMPPASRWELLENVSNATIQPGTLPEGILLRQFPGHLSPQGDEFKYIYITPLILHGSSKGQELLKIDSLKVRSSIFTRKKGELIFSTSGMEPRDLYLSFNVKEGKGDLIIYLNGHIISESELSKGITKPILLPKQYLNEGENKIILEVSPPGLAFWRSNYYYLESITVVGNLMDKGTVKREVYLREGDLTNIEDIKLKFSLNCDRQYSQLIILVNGKTFINESLMCMNNYNFKLPPTFLTPGTNTLSFYSPDPVSISNIFLEMYYAAKVYPIYYFEVPANIDRQYNLVIKFADTTRHVLTVEINGERFTIDTFKDTYVKDITQYIESGINALKLIPQVDVDIREVRVEVG